MFYNCPDITEIDLSKFNSSQINSKFTMFGMFKDCHSLTSLDLSNFDASKVTCIHYLFSGCSNLQYINFGNFSEKELIDGHYTNIFDGVPDNIVACINENVSIETFSLLNAEKCYTIDCSNNWKLKQKKMINGNCLSDDNNISDYGSILKIIEDYFMNNYDTSNLDSGEDELFDFDKIKITLTTPNNQKNN